LGAPGLLEVATDETGIPSRVHVVAALADAIDTA